MSDKSAFKRDRQNKKKNIRNTGLRTRVKSETKSVLDAVASNDKAAAEAALKSATTTISKVASKGVLHKRTASRKISGLTKKVHQLTA